MRRDDAAEAAARREARQLLEQVRAGDHSALPVLVDALLLSDAPHDGERLARALKGPRHVIDAALKRAAEGLSYPSERERREFEERELSYARAELRRVDAGWQQAPAHERTEEIRRVTNDIQTDPELLAERIHWLFEGVFGHGSMLLAREIVDSSPRVNRDAQLFRLVVSLDDAMGWAGVDRVWRALPPATKDAVAAITQSALREQGAEQPAPARRRSRRVR